MSGQITETMAPLVKAWWEGLSQRQKDNLFRAVIKEKIKETLGRAIEHEVSKICGPIIEEETRRMLQEGFETRHMGYRQYVKMEDFLAKSLANGLAHEFAKMTAEVSVTVKPGKEV